MSQSVTRESFFVVEGAKEQTMEIIRPSTVEITCDLCKAVLAVAVTDVHVSELHGPEYTCSCPECGNSITLRRGQIPQWWLPRLHPGD